MSKSIAVMLSILLGWVIAGPAGAEVTGTEEVLKVEQQGDITYISGGVSDEEQQAIKDLGEDFNLKLLMAIEAGNYLSGTQVKIMDEQGNMLLEAMADGPFFYARLAPGTYTVEASGFDESYQKTVTVPDQGQEQVNFYWPNTVADEKPKME